MMSGTKTDETTGKLQSIERPQITGAFPNSDRMNGNLEFLCKSNDDAPAGTSIQLRHDQAGNIDHLLKNLNLLNRVLASRRIKNKQHGMWRIGI